ncbi:hypothetical protein KIPB_016883, partial [Kipferlia bialata]|eukprot:g16883.t1
MCGRMPIPSMDSLLS